MIRSPLVSYVGRCLIGRYEPGELIDRGATCARWLPAKARGDRETIHPAVVRINRRPR
jgi:hypothetical protein